MSKAHKHPRHGAALEHGEAHTREHQLWSRRDFLSASGILGAGSLLMGNIGLRAFQPTPLMASLANGANDRILVLIRFDGGNDGLNMVIPAANYDRYVALRPYTHIGDNAFIPLDNTLPTEQQVGLHPSMTAIKEMYDNGWANVVQAAGYQSMNQSHFKGTDLWLSGGDAVQY